MKQEIFECEDSDVYNITTTNYEGIQTNLRTEWQFAVEPDPEVLKHQNGAFVYVFTSALANSHTSFEQHVTILTPKWEKTTGEWMQLSDHDLEERKKDRANGDVIFNYRFLGHMAEHKKCKQVLSFVTFCFDVLAQSLDQQSYVAIFF